MSYMPFYYGVRNSRYFFSVAPFLVCFSALGRYVKWKTRGVFFFFLRGSDFIIFCLLFIVLSHATVLFKRSSKVWFHSLALF